MTRPTNPTRLCAAGLSLAIVAAGCESSGLSARETDHRDYSSYVHALYDEPALPPGSPADSPAGAQVPMEPQAPAKLVLPCRLAVAQVGEVAPPQAFLQKLRDQAGLFTRVETVSGISAEEGLVTGEAQDEGFTPRHVAGPPAPGRAWRNASAREVARRDLARMRRQARDMGMDHLLVVGGTIDQTTQDNGLGVMDLTIVGAFVVPSKEIKAEARAAAALIDVPSGRVIMTASSDTSRKGVASSATQESGQINVLREARDEVVNKLADSVIAQCRQRQGDGQI